MRVQSTIDAIQTGLYAGALEAYSLRHLAETGLLDEYDKHPFSLIIYPRQTGLENDVRVSVSPIVCDFTLKSLQIPGPIEDHLRYLIFQNQGRVTVRVTSRVVVIEIRQNGELWSTKLTGNQDTQQIAFSCFQH